MADTVWTLLEEAPTGLVAAGLASLCTGLVGAVAHLLGALYG